MKWLNRIFMSLGVLVLICFGGFVLYGVAYSEGTIDGHNNGYEQGHTLGQQEGYNSGKTEGHQIGKKDGYDEGYLNGKAEGYEDGYEKGVEAGLGHGYTIINPTYKQVIRFFKEDNTDENEYNEDSYSCSHFARDVCNNAESAGLRCAFVSLRYPERGHAIVAFNTIDEGLVYFDPQHDEKVRPIIGKRYYKCIEPRPGYYYERPPYDDTIKDILVIW